MSSENSGLLPQSDIMPTKDLYAKVGSEGVNGILGELLTFADMSFSNDTQGKAFKDMVKAAMWRWWHSYTLYERENSVNSPE